MVELAIVIEAVEIVEIVEVNGMHDSIDIGRGFNSLPQLSGFLGFSLLLILLTSQCALSPNGLE